MFLAKSARSPSGSEKKKQGKKKKKCWETKKREKLRFKLKLIRRWLTTRRKGKITS